MHKKIYEYANTSIWKLRKTGDILNIYVTTYLAGVVIKMQWNLKERSLQFKIKTIQQCNMNYKTHVYLFLWSDDT